MFGFSETCTHLTLKQAFCNLFGLFFFVHFFLCNNAYTFSYKCIHKFWRETTTACLPAVLTFPPYSPHCICICILLILFTTLAKVLTLSDSENFKFSKSFFFSSGILPNNTRQFCYRILYLSVPVCLTIFFLTVIVWFYKCICNFSEWEYAFIFLAFFFYVDVLFWLSARCR